MWIYLFVYLHIVQCKAHLGGQQISQSKHWKACALPTVSQLWYIALAKKEDWNRKRMCLPSFSSPTDVPRCENISCSVPDHLFKLMFWYLNVRQISCPFNVWNANAHENMHVSEEFRHFLTESIQAVFRIWVSVASKLIISKARDFESVEKTSGWKRVTLVPFCPS